MRVIHVPRRFTLNAWGGTETHILEIARRLKSHDIQTEIFCPSALDAPGEEELQGVRVRRFPYFLSLPRTVQGSNGKDGPQGRKPFFAVLASCTST